MVLKQNVVVPFIACIALTACTAVVPDTSAPAAEAQRQLTLARQLRKAGDLKGAELRSKVALALCEKAYGADALELTDPLEVLISSSCAQGQCADTEGYWRRMLALREKHLGKNEANTIATVCQLGEICEQKFKYAEAKDLYLRALSVREAQKSFLVSPTLIALARLESTQGSQLAARAYLKRAEDLEKANASPVNMQVQIEKIKRGFRAQIR